MTRAAPNPSERHERRVEILAGLAQLTGHHADLGAWPDDTIPDVLRADLSRRRIYVGDAKASEYPGNRDTVARLSGYVAWLAVAVRAGAMASLMLCAPGQQEAEGWGRVVDLLPGEQSQTAETHLVALGPGAAASWSIVSPARSLTPCAVQARADQGGLLSRVRPLPSTFGYPIAL